mmetsp:Transcript_24680/g.36378  ORF Transcript_24680/g.36378 Transcript_24680/m.36378 type:complete len:360 (-) Transcript_24680:436-1515(-)
MGASGSVASPLLLDMDTSVSTPIKQPPSSVKPADIKSNRHTTDTVFPSEKLIITYSRDPHSFTNLLQNKIQNDGISCDDLKQHIKDICHTAKVPDKDIDDFIEINDFSDGACSISDVIKAFDRQMNRLLEVQSKSFNATSYNREKILNNAKEAVMSRTAAIETLIKQTQLNNLTKSYKTDPVSFAKRLHAASEDAFNSLSKEALISTLMSYVPDATEEDVTSTLNKYEAKYGAKSDIIDINLFLEFLEQTVNSALRAEKRLPIERERLDGERKLAQRIEERYKKVTELLKKAELDSITSLYTLEPAAFQADLARAMQGRKNIPCDEFQDIIRCVARDSTVTDIEQLWVIDAFCTCICVI